MSQLPEMTHAEVLRKIEREIDTIGSKAAAARHWGISPQLLDFILKRQRGIGPKLLKALGLKRTTIVVQRYGASSEPTSEVAAKVERGSAVSYRGPVAERQEPE